MNISRRDFLRLCTASSAALALSPLDIFRLEEALANPSGPSVLWLQWAGCTGCSVSLLNRVAPTAPTNGADLLINTINLAYHPNLMAAAGDTAVAVAREVYNVGGYVLAVEGGIPTAFGGNACWAWRENERDVTFADAVTSLAGKAAVVLSVGTCAAWGGISAAYPNPTGVKGVSAVLGQATVNIPGCPPHPDWMVWTIAKLLAGTLTSLDEYGRPAGLFTKKVHDICPRKGKGEIKTYGVDGKCMKPLGCQGPKTLASCPTLQWNNGANWCVDANNPCIGCTNPTFPALTLRKEAQ
jgi:hydrogenase small subunit